MTEIFSREELGALMARDEDESPWQPSGQIMTQDEVDAFLRGMGGGEPPVAAELRRLQDENENLANAVESLRDQDTRLRIRCARLESQVSYLSCLPPRGAALLRRIKYLVTGR